MSYLFTSESVSEGHADKVADLISDAVATYILDKNPAHRAAVETLVTTNMVTLAGEYKSTKEIDKSVIADIVRNTVKDIGYEQEGFHWQHLKIYNELHPQSADIALGTDDFGAGDQGLMFGYACRETPNYMPSAIYYSHRIVEALTAYRRNGAKWMGPDSKSQVTFEYDDNATPVRIAKVVCSTQHSDDMDIETVRKYVKDIILRVLPAKLVDNATEFYINPTGRFVIGGPDGDTGLTGRKIIVDTYGGYAPHGGGAFSGKDPTKVDRSAAYMMRYLAKNIVASGHADWATCQVSYAIGVKEPMSLYIESNGNSRALTDWVTKNIDLTPKGIIDRFDLFSVQLTDTTNYGHFGKDHLPWEKVDLNIELRIS
jgi:S-adenosylmethionine synthetase